MASRLSPWAAPLRSLCMRTRQTSQASPHNHARFAAAPATTSPLTSKRFMSTPGNPTQTPETDADVEVAPETIPYKGPEIFAPNFHNGEVLQQLQKESEGVQYSDEVADGLLFSAPAPPTKNDKLQNRYDPLVHQLTRMIMQDGKLGTAQKNFALILNFLRTSPPPKVNPLRPLLPGGPPPSQLPLNPLLYLTLALDSVAPIVKVMYLKGKAGGGAALDVPEPLSERVRRRMAFNWILEAVNKKPSRGSGRNQFASRVADEIIAVAEGRSPVWDRRQTLHKLGTAARANLAIANRGKIKKF